MKRKYLAVLSVVVLAGALGCGLIDSVVGNVTGANKAGTVTDLWPDVPRMDGLNKSDIQLPLAGQLAVKAMSQGSFDFIAFTTSQTSQDVVNYYTEDRMKSAGWASDTGTGGCQVGDSSSSSGGVCIFERSDGGKTTGLMIVIAQDDSTKQTQLFFIRITDVGTPTK
ncbi:MAG: hypothetical protein M1482_03895 [Chloroflexi bacterium]|nr:hypothetical protein [Chloroflexota bacterium]